MLLLGRYASSFDSVNNILKLFFINGRRKIHFAFKTKHSSKAKVFIGEMQFSKTILSLFVRKYAGPVALLI